MTNKLSELSKPVAWTWNAYGMQHATTEEDESAELILDGVDVNPLYSQEYVSALLSQIEADREIKARLCRESNSLHDRLKAAEKRSAELETLLERNKMRAEKLGELLATPVRLPVAKDKSQGWTIDPDYLSAIAAKVGHSEDEGSPSMETVEAVLLAAGFTVEGDE